jgi:hypothetical protein
MKHRCVITNPGSVISAKQFIAGTNVGYLTSSTITSYTSAGINTSTTSCTGFALIVSGGGAWDAEIKVTGFNN